MELWAFLMERVTARHVLETNAIHAQRACHSLKLMILIPVDMIAYQMVAGKKVSTQESIEINQSSML
jgi:hypothetical protein